jgi:RHS repeat-associated protein
MQDHLGSTSGTASNAGVSTSTIRYFPFGLTRTISGTLSIDKLFTGQRKVNSDINDGLYYYGARYYDAGIGRFLSPDSVIPNISNPQSLNRYSYCYNNPLKMVDPSGHMPIELLNLISEAYNAGEITQETATLLIIGANGTSIQGMFVAMHEIAAVNVAHEASKYHEQVQLEYKVGSNNEADVVADGLFVWEIKPGGKAFETQLKNYMALGNLEAGEPLGTLEDIPVVGNIKMKVISNDKGEAHYSFYLDGGKEKIKSPGVNKEMLDVAKSLIFAAILYGLIATAGEIIGTIVVPK